MSLEVRFAEPGDLNRLVEIYNHYVTETHVTFDTEPFAVGARTQWFTQFAETGPYRLLVGVSDDAVIGYASSTRFKSRPAYKTSVETTIYLDPHHTGKGFGRQLYTELLRQLQDAKSVHRAYGGIAQPNPESRALRCWSRCWPGHWCRALRRTVINCVARQSIRWIWMHWRPAGFINCKRGAGWSMPGVQVTRPEHWKMCLSTSLVLHTRKYW